MLVGIRAAADDADLAADALWQAGATAVEERPAHDGVVLVADVPPDAVGARWRPEPLDVSDDRWRDEWRAWARPVRAGRRLVVRPPWCPFAAGPDDVVLDIDPGRAFGSGSHASTRLALAALEDVPVTGRTVLDMGCGSGVLAVAAAVLGATRVTAVDIDEAALEATRANARRNGVEDRVVVAREVNGGFDVVVANLELPTLLERAPTLVASAAGALVVSGFLTECVDDVRRAFGVGRTIDEDGWSAVIVDG